MYSPEAIMAKIDLFVRVNIDLEFYRRDGPFSLEFQKEKDVDAIYYQLKSMIEGVNPIAD